MNPLDFPAHWKQSTLADVGKVVSGGTPSTKNSAYWGDEIAWISPSDLTGYKEKFISRGAKSLSKAGLKHSSAKLMPKGSVHFSSRAPIGYVVISSESLCTNQGFKSLVPGPDVFNEYVYHYLKSIKDLAESRATGTTFKELSGAAFKKLPIPLPPLEEQKQIVAKIEELFSELDAGEASLRQAKTQLNTYRQSLLKQAFQGKLTEKWREQNLDEVESPDQLLARIQTERQERYEENFREWEINFKAWQRCGKNEKRPAKPRKIKISSLHKIVDVEFPSTLPKGWKWTCISEVAQIGTGATPQRSETSFYDKGDIPWITSTVVNDDIVRAPNGFVTKKALEMTNLQIFPPGSLIIALYGEGKTRGKVAETTFETTTNQALAVVVQNGTETCVRPYLKLFLRKNYQDSRSLSSGGVQPNLNLGLIEQMPFPLCPLPEQKEIVRILDEQFEEMDRNEQEIDQALEKAGALRQSILKQAFSGQLTAGAETVSIGEP